MADALPDAASAATGPSHWCPCHGFGAIEVMSALNQGAETVAQIFRHIGVCAKCGDCVPTIRDTLRKTRESDVVSLPSQKENTVNNQTKVKVAVMLDDGDKLEYEAHVSETDLEGAKAEAERRLRSAVATLNGKGDALRADRVKIETH